MLKRTFELTSKLNQRGGGGEEEKTKGMREVLEEKCEGGGGRGGGISGVLFAVRFWTEIGHTSNRAFKCVLTPTAQYNGC